MRILIVTLEPVRQEASMDLVKFNDEQVINCFVHNQLGDSMLFWTMSITQADLLIVVTVVAQCSAVEVSLEVFETHPEDAIKVIIHAQFLTEITLVRLGLILPPVLPLALCSGPVRIANLQQSDKLIIFINDCNSVKYGVGVVIRQALSLDCLTLPKLDRVYAANHGLIPACALVDYFP